MVETRAAFGALFGVLYAHNHVCLCTVVHMPLFCCFHLRQDGTEWGETTLTGNEKVEDTVQCISSSGRPGHATLNVSQGEEERERHTPRQKDEQ